jgi:type VI secretion system protein ImpJ
MKRMQHVVWTKGTFLSPQHMQVQDKFTEDTLNFRLQALSFCPWGFSRLMINQETLAEGVLTLSSACGIFPDGLLFNCPDTDPLPPSKSLTECFEPGAKSLDVFLTVPEYRQRGQNVAIAKQDATTRFLAEMSFFRDENGGTTEKPLQIARKNLRLLAGDESREGCSAIQVANVERSATGTYVLNSQFVPPLLNIAENEYLTGLLRSLVGLLSARSTELSGNRREKNRGLADFSASDIANFWLLYTVNAAFPAINQLFHSKNAHPEELYSAMISLAGSLTTFSSELHPRDFPLYAHESLGPVFSELNQKLRTLLLDSVPRNIVSLPLNRVKQSIYSTSIDDEKYLVNTKLYLAFNAEATEDVLIQRVPQIVKACSASHIEHLINQALPGIALRHLSNPPDAIPVKLKYQYFSLSQSGAAWEAVLRARNFAVYVPQDLPNPTMELIVLLPGPG